MRNIIIVECISTGINFIEDIINMGHNPVVLHLKLSEGEIGKRFDEHVYEEYKRIDHDFDMIFERDTYEETVEEVKKYDPLLVLPGNERGVVLATRLSHELGLLGNPIENLDAMTLKDQMHNRLAENGLRSIKGNVIHSIEEAIEFYDGENLKKVVIKPIRGAGSTNVRICMDRQEMIDSAEMLLDASNRFGDKNDELLIQEFIEGTEYIVNTVSHKGIHRVTLVWKYNKITTSEGAIIYDSCETVNELGLGEAEMVEYAYSVADALGIQYGPVHGEYMIDEDGPVLIEVNCRPCGGNMPAEFLNTISGQHETDSILNSYLKPKHFFEELKRKYNLYSYGAIKFFIASQDVIARSSPFAGLGRRLRSYCTGSLTNTAYDDVVFRKTEDVQTSAGNIYLAHEDKAILHDDLEFLRELEKNAFSLILSDDSMDVEIKDDEDYLNDILPLVENVEKYGFGLFVTDQFVDGIDILQVNCDDLDDVKGDFDLIFINLNRSLVDKSEVEKVKILLNIFSKIKVGGIIFIPKNTYELMSNGRDGMEALIKVLDYKIELPPFHINDMILASRRS